MIFNKKLLRNHTPTRLASGKIGPVLNALMSVIEYRSLMMIRECVRQPLRYRHTHMPDHDNLPDRDMDDLLDYFRHQASAGQR